MDSPATNKLAAHRGVYAFFPVRPVLVVNDAIVLDAVIRFSRESVNRYRAVLRQLFPLVFLCSFVGCTVGGLTFGGIIESKLCLLSFSCLPIFFLFVPLWNLNRMKLLASFFELWFLFAQALMWFVSAGFVFEFDIRFSVMIPHLLNTMQVIGLDASPSPPFMKIITVVMGLLTQATLALCVFLNLPSHGNVSITNDHKSTEHEIYIVGISLVAEQVFIGRTLTLISIFTRHLYVNVFYKGQSVIIHSRFWLNTHLPLETAAIHPLQLLRIQQQHHRLSFNVHPVSIRYHHHHNGERQQSESKEREQNQHSLDKEDDYDGDGRLPIHNERVVQLSPTTSPPPLDHPHPRDGHLCEYASMLQLPSAYSESIPTNTIINNGIHSNKNADNENKLNSTNSNNGTIKLQAVRICLESGHQTVLEALTHCKPSTADHIRQIYIRYSPLFSLMTIFGTLIIVLTFFSVLPYQISPCSLVLFIPATLSFLLMNFGLVKELITCFEVWFLLLQLAGTVVCGIFILDLSVSRSCAIVSATPPAIAIIFYDASLTSSSRKLASSIACFTAVVLLSVAVYFGFHSSNTRHTIVVLHRTFRIEDIFLSFLLNIGALYAKQLFTTLRNPGSSSILSSRYYLLPPSPPPPPPPPPTTTSEQHHLSLPINIASSSLPRDQQAVPPIRKVNT